MECGYYFADPELIGRENEEEVRSSRGSSNVSTFMAVNPGYLVWGVDTVPNRQIETPEVTL